MQLMQPISETSEMQIDSEDLISGEDYFMLEIEALKSIFHLL